MGSSSVSAPLDVLVVINPAASRFPRGAVRLALRAALLRRKCRFRIVQPNGDGDMRASIRREIIRALAEGCGRVIAAGGDGTIEMVAASLANGHGPRATLAIIPAGTANVLSRELGIPQALPDAAALAVEGNHALDLDGIRVDGHLVLTQVGVGPDALMIRDTRREHQDRHGRLAYLFGFLRRAAAFSPRHFDLEIDGERVRARAWQIIVANSGSAGLAAFTYGPDVNPTDGVADLCIYDVRGRRDYFHLAWRVLTGRHRRDTRSQFFRVRREVTIRTRRPVLVQGDGEIVARTPVTLEVSRAAARVVVPKAIEGTRHTPPPARDAAPAPPAPGDTAAPHETVAGDVATMIAERSPTWVLQGALHHPGAAIAALDAALYIRLNGMTLGDWGDRFLLALSQLMHYGEGWAIVVLAMTITHPRQGLATAAEALPVLWITMLTVNYPLKRTFRRRRPFAAFVKARVVGPRPRDYSFPSGHAAAAFAGALMLSIHEPAWAPALFTIAGLVGFSRIYLGVHYPGDVLTGGVIGMALAMIYRQALWTLVGWWR